MFRESYRSLRDRASRRYLRFFKRQLSLPVSMMSQWWVSRSRSAVVILLSREIDLALQRAEELS
jgi:hypothetical protein